MELSTGQVLAWRQRRQYVDGSGPGDPALVVERLVGVQAQVPAAADLALALRGSAGGAQAALGAGRLLRTWGQRGTLHLLTPGQAADVLALMASARTWEKPAWTREFGATPAQVAELTARVDVLLRGRVLTREELAAELAAEPEFASLRPQLASGWGALLKPLAWQGVLCHAPTEGARTSFAHPADLAADWPAPPPVEEAGPRVLAAYLAAYGPAGLDRFDAWLSRNSLRKAVLKSFAATLGDRLAEVRVDGEPGYALAEHLGELAAAEPAPSVHLLGAFDQYLLGPGTKAAEILPAAHRAEVSRAGGWIAPLLLVDGRIAGVWELAGTTLTVRPFDAPPPAAALDAAAERLAAASGLDGLTVRLG
ncbi:crosslink repair DNA glycosylase YcaQ family protein [Kitasatospora sp. NPDC049285]|uniref:DNA glycosylase AlkZ-like family protein n=1 Tax=Kitasatospora sp. NPDC049285 TaxID=3157096 RepID=UPI0034307EA3